MYLLQHYGVPVSTVVSFAGVPPGSVQYAPGLAADGSGASDARCKRALCTHWMRDNACPYGDGCWFAHGMAELGRPVRPPAPQPKTRLCSFFANNKACPYGVRCAFAHGQEEMQSVGPSRTTYVRVTAPGPETAAANPPTRTPSPIPATQPRNDAGNAGSGASGHMTCDGQAAGHQQTRPSQVRRVPAAGPAQQATRQRQQAQQRVQHGQQMLATGPAEQAVEQVQQQAQQPQQVLVAEPVQRATRQAQQEHQRARPQAQLMFATESEGHAEQAQQTRQVQPQAQQAQTVDATKSTERTDRRVQLTQHVPVSGPQVTTETQQEHQRLPEGPCRPADVMCRMVAAIADDEDATAPRERATAEHAAETAPTKKQHDIVGPSPAHASTSESPEATLAGRVPPGEPPAPPGHPVTTAAVQAVTNVQPARAVPAITRRTRLYAMRPDTAKKVQARAQACLATPSTAFGTTAVAPGKESKRARAVQEGKTTKKAKAL